MFRNSLIELYLTSSRLEGDFNDVSVILNLLLACLSLYPCYSPRSLLLDCLDSVSNSTGRLALAKVPNMSDGPRPTLQPRYLPTSATRLNSRAPEPAADDGRDQRSEGGGDAAMSLCGKPKTDCAHARLQRLLDDSMVVSMACIGVSNRPLAMPCGRRLSGSTDLLYCTVCSTRGRGTTSPADQQAPRLPGQAFRRNNRQG